MSRPLCIRIEITYEDGSMDSANGEQAEAIIRYFEKVQTINFVNGAPQFRHRPAASTDNGIHFGVSE